MLTALSSFPAVQFIRSVLTLWLPVTNLSLRDAHLPVGALKLIWGGAQNYFDSYHGLYVMVKKIIVFRVNMIPKIDQDLKVN